MTRRSYFLGSIIILNNDQNTGRYFFQYHFQIWYQSALGKDVQQEEWLQNGAKIILLYHCSRSAGVVGCDLLFGFPLERLCILLLFNTHYTILWSHSWYRHHDATMNGFARHHGIIGVTTAPPTTLSQYLIPLNGVIRHRRPFKFVTHKRVS